MVVPIFVVILIVPVLELCPTICKYSVFGGVQLYVVDPPLEIVVIVPEALPSVYVIVSVKPLLFLVMEIVPAVPTVNEDGSVREDGAEPFRVKV